MKLKIQPNKPAAIDLFLKGTLALAKAERLGMRIDVDYCERASKHITRQVRYLRKKIYDSHLISEWRKTFGRKFNMDSGDQLAEVLYNRMGIEPVKMTEHNKPSVDEEALDALGLPEVDDLVMIRRLNKVKGTYLENLLREQVDGIIHPNFNLHLTATFRPSTDNPNLANIPNREPTTKKLVRRAIKVRPGHKLIAADFKAIEVGIAACYHEDPEMIKYAADSTKDMHRDMAMKLYILSQAEMTKKIRQSGKNRYVFPEFYGDYYGNCARYLWADAKLPTHILENGTPLIDHLKSHKLRTLDEFTEHVKKVERWMWYEKWKVYTEWKEAWIKQYQRQGFFDTLTGFRCSGVMSRNQTINYPVQGTAFHCLLQVIIWLTEDGEKEGWDSRVCNQIYDDVMIDAHPDEERMIVERLNYYMNERLPKHWGWINVPLKVEIEATPVDGTWYDKDEKWLYK